MRAVEERKSSPQRTPFDCAQGRHRLHEGHEGKPKHLATRAEGSTEGALCGLWKKEKAHHKGHPSTALRAGIGCTKGTKENQNTLTTECKRNAEGPESAFGKR